MSEEANKPDDTDVPPEKPVRYWPVYLGYRIADGPLWNDTPLSPAIQHLPGIPMLLLAAGAFVLFLVSLCFGEWFVPLGLIAAHLPFGLAFHLFKRGWRSPEARKHRERLDRYSDLTENVSEPKAQDYSVGIELELNDRIESLADSDAVEWNQFDSYQFLGMDGDTWVVRLDPIGVNPKSRIRSNPLGGLAHSLEYLLWILPTGGVATLFAVSLRRHGWHADTLATAAVFAIHLVCWFGVGLWLWEAWRTPSTWWCHPKSDGSTYLLFDQRAISKEEASALLRRYLPEKSADAA